MLTPLIPRVAITGVAALFTQVYNFRQLQLLEKDLSLTTQAYESESESRAGHHHTVDILKGLLDQCGFAVIVVTPEDKTAKGDIEHARMSFTRSVFSRVAWTSRGSQS